METTTKTKTLSRRLIAIREAREARAERRALQNELANYTTESDLADLEAILDRHSDEETADIRRLLAVRRAA